MCSRCARIQRAQRLGASRRARSRRDVDEHRPRFARSPERARVRRCRATCAATCTTWTAAAADSAADRTEPAARAGASRVDGRGSRTSRTRMHSERAAQLATAARHGRDGARRARRRPAPGAPASDSRARTSSSRSRSSSCGAEPGAARTALQTLLQQYSTSDLRPGRAVLSWRGLPSGGECRGSRFCVCCGGLELSHVSSRAHGTLQACAGYGGEGKRRRRPRAVESIS